MNSTEITALSKPISNDARVLYCLGLRPTANNLGESEKLNYKALMQLVNGKEQAPAKACYTLGRQINRLLKELSKVGLIALDINDSLDHSLNGKSITLPLMIFSPANQQNIPAKWHNMQADWHPETKIFNDISQLVGLIDKEYEAEELGEFIAYWQGRPEKYFTPYQWTQKFVMQLKHKRLARPASNQIKVGSQIINAPSSISVDENGKALIEKYSK